MTFPYILVGCVDPSLLPEELCGWERHGFHYCRDHSPPGDPSEWTEIYLAEVDDEQCNACCISLVWYAVSEGMA